MKTNQSIQVLEQTIETINLIQSDKKIRQILVSQGAMQYFNVTNEALEMYKTNLSLILKTLQDLG